MPAPKENQTVGGVIARMRKLLGHLGPRDRQTVVDGIEAILELSTRLHEITHVKETPKGKLIVRSDEPESRAAEGHTTE